MFGEIKMFNIGSNQKAEIIFLPVLLFNLCF